MPANSEPYHKTGGLQGLLNELIADVYSQGDRVSQDLGILKSIGQAEINDSLIDDEKYLTERVIQLAASLPNGSKAASDLTDTLIETLWDSLKHPPVSSLGNQFKYRTADGSNNSLLYPQLGAAGSSYARSVRPQTLLPPVLPDPSTIFDVLLARKGPAKEHPNKISTTLFSFATLIIHDIFRTSDRDPTKVDSSSYLDLGPLYGHNLEEQNTIRTFRNGLLKPDAFTEKRLLGQPPGVCALVIAFNRYHNYVVKELAIINENDRFGLPVGLEPADDGYGIAQAKRDNDLFQTGRLITCGLYVNIILNDYVRTILNLNRSNSTWGLDPRENFTNPFDAAGFPQGIGNQVSVEFNFIYRWHSTISDHVAGWAESFYSEIFPGQNANQLPLAEFLTGLRTWARGINPDPGQQTFGGLKRNAAGSFEDAELVGLLTESTDDVAAAFGARNIPAIMKAVEILGIQQGRQYNLASLNEVRKFFKLKPHATFLEINSDPSVAEALETLYGHPDNVELYPGLQAEEAKAVFVPGSGLCPGLTISTAILSDAVALVRGDRFYTVDFSPANLTNWGYNTIATDSDISGGGVMYKLLMNAFPGMYRFNSVYAMLPFTIPEENRKILETLGKEQNYDFTAPVFQGPPTPVLSWDGVVSVLSDQENYKVPWGPHTSYLTGHDYMLSGDTPANHEQRVFVQKAIYSPSHGLDEIRKFYESITTEMIHQNSHKLGESYQLDVVQDIANPSHASFIAHLFHIPLGGGSDSYTETSLHSTLANLFAYVFLDIDPTTSFALRSQALKDTTDLGKTVLNVVQGMRTYQESLKEVTGLEPQERVLHDYGTHLVKRLFEGGKSVDEVVWTIIPTAAAAVATQAQGISQILDFYLSDQYVQHWPAIQVLARSDSPEAFETLKKYALEALRLSPPASGLVRVASSPSTIHDGSRPIPIQAGDAVFLDFTTAGRDPAKFPNPLTIDLTRPYDDYIHHGYGAHACLGRPIATVAAAAQLRVFGRLDGLKRAPGQEGEMRRKVVGGLFEVWLEQKGDGWGRFPTRKLVHFDGFGGDAA
ncbi:hypothetical protein MMC18_009386 [Xylographa bjoerkii]|nr:hypothetical protein [Xylographa bjoerkii]